MTGVGRLGNAGNTATIGITDHAQHELTDVVFIELPVKGRELKAGERVPLKLVVRDRKGVKSTLQVDAEVRGVTGQAQHKSH